MQHRLNLEETVLKLPQQEKENVQLIKLWNKHNNKLRKRNRQRVVKQLQLKM